MTLPIPSPPTDNLYKFTAIFFLSAFLACSYLIYSKEKEILAQIDDFHQRNLVFQMQTEAKVDAQVEPGKDTISGQAEVLTDSFKSAEEMSFEAEESTLEKKVERFLKERKSLIWLMWSLGFCAVVSFCFWWERFQRHQDRLLRLTLEEAELKVAKLREAPKAVGGGHVVGNG